jgi:hypothetical protein
VPIDALDRDGIYLNLRASREASTARSAVFGIDGASALDLIVA